MFSIETVELLARFHSRLNDETELEEGRSFDPTSIITVLSTVIPILSQLISLCKKQPPETPPIPEELSKRGISFQNWEKAFRTNWGATNSWKEDKQKYTPAIVNSIAKQISESEKTKKKLAKPMATTVLNSSRQEKIEVVAIALQDLETHNSRG